jgi:hypothetical protein
MMMPLAGMGSVYQSVYQVAPALLVGIVLGMRKSCTLGYAAALGAKLCFILGAAMMLFSEARWWPVTWSMAVLVSRVLAAWIAAAAAYAATKQLKGLLLKS